MPDNIYYVNPSAVLLCLYEAPGSLIFRHELVHNDRWNILDLLHDNTSPDRLPRNVNDVDPTGLA